MSLPALDPALATVLHASFAVLWAWSALHKWRDLGSFTATLDAYALLPSAGVKPFALLIAGTEALLAVASAWPGSARTAALASAAVLTVYAAAIAVNLRSGRRDIDCGCSGPSRAQPLHGVLVVRNFLLAGLALLASTPAAARDLTWVDATTIAATVVTASFLYLAIDRLVAQVPRSPSQGHLHREVAHA